MSGRIRVAMTAPLPGAAGHLPEAEHDILDVIGGRRPARVVNPEVYG
jgi:hypothetical protein